MIKSPARCVTGGERRVSTELANLTTGLQHVGIPTQNISQTIAFYVGLGFKISLKTRNEATGEDVCFLRLKNLCIEVWQTKAVAGKPGAIDHIALDVTDIEDAFQQVSASGYHVLDEKIQFLPFWQNGVRFFTILGPNSEKLEFSQML